MNTGKQSYMCEDHLGNRYNNEQEMCDHWGIKRSTFIMRLKAGWSLEDALTNKVNRRTEMYTDHLGNKFNTLAEVYEYWGISKREYRSMASQGYSLADITLMHKSNTRPVKYTDHLGNEFKSFKSMCRYWGMPDNTVRRRLNRGYTLEYSLTNPVRDGSSKKCKDHLGNEFNSVFEMCKYWNIAVCTYYNRINHGCSLEEALSGIHRAKIVDHLGNKYNTVKDMCEHWGVSISAFYSRIGGGASVEDALTHSTLYTSDRYKCKDHLGQEFKSKSDMCRHWGITVQILYSRLKSGLSLKDALEKGRVPTQNDKE